MTTLSIQGYRITRDRAPRWAERVFDADRLLATPLGWAVIGPVRAGWGVSITAHGWRYSWTLPRRAEASGPPATSTLLTVRLVVKRLTRLLAAEPRHGHAGPRTGGPATDEPTETDRAS